MNNKETLPVFVVTELEQAKLLADPLKLRLLTAFAEGPKTTKQVSKEIGESLTKLYRHVDALYEAGLLIVTAESPRRGFTERTFQAIARRFEADRSLFRASGDLSSAADTTLRSLLHGAEDEIITAIRVDDRNYKPFIVRLRTRLSSEQAAVFEKALSDLIESISDSGEETEGEDVTIYGGLIAFYPIDK